MKLKDLIPLNELEFRNQDHFDRYSEKHKMRPDTKVTIAGKDTTAGEASKDSKGTSVFGKGSSVFGGDDSEKEQGGLMRKIKDFAGSKGFQFGARRPDDQELSVANSHFADYDNKEVGSVGVDKVTGNIYASNGEYEVILSPDGKLLKKDSMEDGYAAIDRFLKKQAEDEDRKDQRIKKIKSMFGLDEVNKLKNLIPTNEDKSKKLKSIGKEFKGTYDLSDIGDAIKDSLDVSDKDGKELQKRLEKGEKGKYKQTSETGGEIVFANGDRYEVGGTQDSPYPVTKKPKRK